MKANKTKIIPQMAEDLKRLGLTPGDCLIVHSSYKALGLQHHGPSDVINTLLHVLGPDGTLMMPTFTYSYSGISGVKPFNPRTTPGKANGILTETLRTFPRALRSRHPTYSVAAIGKNAEQITRNKEQASPLGRGSSYDEAYKLNAKILLLGAGNNGNSMVHYAEVIAELPYNDIPYRAFWGKTALVESEGKVISVVLPNEFPGCSANFGVADAYLKEKGVMRCGQVCKADSKFMDARTMVARMVERLRQEPAWLLCDNFNCEPCSLRKQRLREKGLI